MHTNNLPLRLLLVEGDEGDFLNIQDLLYQARHLPHALDWISTCAKGLGEIAHQEHDLILVGERCDTASGLDLIRNVTGAGIRTPMILLTDQSDDERGIDAIESGASDYLIKGQFDSSLLARSIRYAIGRNQAISTLAESEHRYRLLFEANPEPMFVFHRETLAFLAANQAAIRLYGYSQDEFLGMTILDLRSCAEQQRFLKFYETIKHYVVDPEAGIWTHRDKCGCELQVKVMLHDFLFNNQPARLALVIDVTEKMKARLEAQRKEKAFRQLMTDSRDALLVVDAENTVHYANPAAETLLRAPLEALLARPLDVPASREGLFEWSLPVSEGSVEVEVQHSQTEWLGEAMQLLSLRDIRQRNESDKQLRLLQRSVEASHNGVLIADARESDMPLIYVNPAFEHITGYKAAEVLGRNCRFLQREDRMQSGIEEIRLGLQEARESHTVLRNFRKDGSPFWNDLYIAPVPNEQGEITHYIGVQNDISVQKRFESELAYNTSHDVLTGLPNRYMLEDRLVQSCQFARRYKRSLAVVLLDLDGFKPINDSLGHGVGDQVLIEVAKRLSRQVRPGDTVARLSGDEFVVLLPDLAREEDVLLVVERLIMNLARPYHVQGVELRITASAGISLSNGENQEPMQLVQQAELTMYKAKQQGRNNYQWYTTDLNQKVSERLMLRNELQKAIEAENLELYYQPQVDSRGQCVVGIEALLRWNHVEMGFISPADFIPVAEDTGQILPLSQWVLETACRHIKALNDQGLNVQSVAVNISPVHFQRANFIESVTSILKRTKLDARFLELELTENILLDNAERAIHTLHKLKDLGVRVAIDDFGTGFSSLNYLKRLPIDKVKIDRSFVREIISDQYDAAITQGIISMVHHLNLKVVAEGVETQAQFAFLRKSQCDAFQGYYFARPMMLGQLEDFLRERKIAVIPTRQTMQG